MTFCMKIRFLQLKNYGYFKIAFDKKSGRMIPDYISDAILKTSYKKGKVVHHAGHVRGIV